MKTKREMAVEALGRMLGPEAAARTDERMASTEFGAGVSVLSMSNVFEALWIRPGMSPRDRSLVTLGILIALRAERELGIHCVAAVRNGVTLPELEEVLYHATGYAGFPAASSARQTAIQALRAAGLLDENNKIPAASTEGN